MNLKLPTYVTVSVENVEYMYNQIKLSEKSKMKIDNFRISEHGQLGIVYSYRDPADELEAIKKMKVGDEN